ncbi:AAA family ATPase [Belliella kenyensis]|uniref:AAA family ATPase n=1 Tax=Belliella kenyensis TaxID=1472724 RepID=A0ABV8EI29_9BACT|nr:MoxR family ATPase [Belliella kenyensis]MCH7402317.1 MoxR family ATPase [Belliella kenyensis]MDN3603508.1 MoxR family ATPase [Belliella kenyensis]
MEENNTMPTGGMEFESRLPLQELCESVARIKAEISKVIVGQEEMIDLLVIGLLSKGHILIEGVPGIAKTISAKLFAKTIKVDFSRIQFTPDLMPSDVLGTSILNMQQGVFEFKRGPIFSNMILIDEINRAPAKTQSALFEVMEERQVTIDGKRYEMAAPFMVLATQNPVEQEGTYNLPEAQLDRFLFKIKLDYPNLEEEFDILQRQHLRKSEEALEQVVGILSPADVVSFQAISSSVSVEEKILRYISQVVVKTRNHPSLYLGASPRASLAVMHASKAMAAVNGRDFVTPEDVKRVIVPALRHRIILNPDREMEGLTTDTVIEGIIQSVEIPR